MFASHFRARSNREEFLQWSLAHKQKEEDIEAIEK